MLSSIWAPRAWNAQRGLAGMARAAPIELGQPRTLSCRHESTRGIIRPNLCEGDWTSGGAALLRQCHVQQRNCPAVRHRAVSIEDRSENGSRSRDRGSCPLLATGGTEFPTYSFNGADSLRGCGEPCRPPRGGMLWTSKIRISNGAFGRMNRSYGFSPPYSRSGSLK
jgi:hypothetical protein